LAEDKGIYTVVLICIQLRSATWKTKLKFRPVHSFSIFYLVLEHVLNFIILFFLAISSKVIFNCQVSKLRVDIKRRNFKSNNCGQISGSEFRNLIIYGSKFDRKIQWSICGLTMWTKTEIRHFFNLNFGQKSKCRSKIQMLVKNPNVGQTSKFR